MKILVVSQHYWPETFQINEVVQSLTADDCSLTVLTGQPNYPDGEIFPGYKARGFGRERHPLGYQIYRVPVVPRASGGSLRLALNYLSFVLTASTVGSFLLRGQTFDIILVYGISPILQGIPGAIFKRTKRAPMIIWLQDLWPQSLEATGFVTNRRLLASVGIVTSWIYRRANLLLIQSAGFEPLIRSMGVNVPIRLHPNPGGFRAKPDQVDSIINLAPCFNVVFAGNLGKAQALGTVIEAASILNKNKQIQFTLVGSGSMSAWLRKEIKQRGLTNVNLPGRFSESETATILAQASVLLVSLKTDQGLREVIPSKIQTYLAAGRPIIGAIEGSGAELILESGAGVTIPSEDSNALASAILELKSLPQAERDRMGKAGFQYYSQNFDSKVLTEKLKAHFKELIENSRPST